MRIQRLGHVPLVGIALIYVLALLPATAIAAPGDLDPSFGDAGQTSFGESFRERVEIGQPATIAFTGDGDIELMGTGTAPAGGEWRMFAARLHEDGALDPSFGSGGWVITRLPPEDEATNTVPDQLINAAALEADGAMVGVGSGLEYGAMGRLTAAGAFDPSFGSSFYNQLPIQAFALVELPNGQMLAGGETPSYGEGARYPALERLLPDGAADPSFGTEGVVQLPNRAGPAASERLLSILLLPDGELLLAGRGEASGEQFGWLAEVTATGSLDRSFGEEGIDYVATKTPFKGGGGVTVAREPDGTIVLVGTASIGSEDWQAAAWGFLPDGAPDPAFGSDGFVLLPRVLPEESAEPRASTVDQNGYVYVDINQQPSGPPDIGSSYVARLTPSGVLDTAYGNGGLVSFPATYVEAIAVDPAGRLVVAGERDRVTYVARLTGGEESGSSAETEGAAGTGLTGGQESGSSAATGGAPGGAHPAPAQPANVPPAYERVTCARVLHGRRRGAERCTLELRRISGTWKSALVLVDRRARRITELRIKRLRMPATIVLFLPANSHPTRWTVVFRDGSRVAYTSSLVVH